MPEQSFGGMLARAALGGVVGAATSKVSTLEEQAKEAKETRLANLAKKNMIEINTQEQGARAEAAKLVSDVQKDQFKVTTDLTKEGMLNDKDYRDKSIALQNKQLDATIQANREAVAWRQGESQRNLQEYKDKLAAATEIEKKQWNDKASALESGYKMGSPSGELSITEKVAVEATKSGLDPSVFSKVQKKYDPKVLDTAMTLVTNAKGAEGKTPVELAIEAHDLADVLLGYTKDKGTQYVEVMELTAAGKVTEEDLAQLVKDEKINKDEAARLTQYIPKKEGEDKSPVPVKEPQGMLNVPANTAVQEDVPGFESSGKGLTIKDIGDFITKKGPERPPTYRNRKLIKK